MANLYRLQYTLTFVQHTKDEVEYFEADNDTAAAAKANSKLDDVNGETNAILYKIGSKISLT